MLFLFFIPLIYEMSALDAGCQMVFINFFLVKMLLLHKYNVFVSSVQRPALKIIKCANIVTDFYGISQNVGINSIDILFLYPIGVYLNETE